MPQKGAERGTNKRNGRILFISIQRKILPKSLLCKIAKSTR